MYLAGTITYFPFTQYFGQCPVFIINDYYNVVFYGTKIIVLLIIF